MSAVLDPDVEDALRKLAAQPAPSPIDRQLAQYPWSPTVIDTQPTRLASRPPPLPPDVIAERLPTVVAPAEHDVAVAIEGGIAAVQQVRELRRQVAELKKRMVRDLYSLKDNLLQLEPHAARAPKLRALITTSLRTCDLALAAAGER